MKVLEKMLTLVFVVVSFLLGYSVLAVGQIVISELAWMGTEASSNDEWIELRNEGSSEISLEGWTLSAVDGSPSINLSGTIPSGGYFLLERTDDESVPEVDANLIYVGSLGNSGEFLELRDGDGALVDSVSAGDGWMAGDNVSKLTMERTGSGWGSSVLVGGTPGVVNSGVVGVSEGGSGEVVEGDVEGVVEVVEVVAKSSGGSVVDNWADGGVASGLNLNYQKLVVSEIYPNPPGSDSEGEFIEFYNNGEGVIDLGGFKIGDDSGRSYKIREKLLGSGKFWVLYRAESGIALNNSEDSVRVYLPGSEEILISVAYSGVLEGYSNSLDDFGKNGEYIWTKVVTPAKDNVIKEKNIAPEVSFEVSKDVTLGRPVLFDASDSYDLNGDKLNYYWNFGDGFSSSLDLVEHTYFNKGTHEVLLRVSDGELENELSFEVNVGFVVTEFEVEEVDGVENFEVESSDGSDDLVILINEVMANPVGSDSEEWIELYNPNEVDINLKGWVVDDKEGGSRAHEFEEDMWILALGYLVMDKEDTKLGLNNSFDEVRSFDSDGDLISGISYSKAKEGMSYGFVEGEWVWIRDGTPGGVNELPVNESLGGVDFVFPDIEAKVGGIDVYDEYIDVALDGVDLYEVGDKVRTAGIVAVLPGVLGTQIYYIVTDGAGVQVYNNKKDFLDFKIGDYVVVQGEVAVSGGEKRIKTRIAGDMKIEDNYAPVEPNVIGVGEFDEELVGQFVEVHAVVTERKGNVVFLDDGEGEIEVYLKSGAEIKAKNIKEGEEYEVLGIVGMMKGRVRLMPRGIEDFVVGDDNGVVRGVGEANEEGRVIADGEGWVLPMRDKKREMFEYLLAGGGMMCLVLLGWLWRLERG